MPYYFFQWTDALVEYLAEHGVSPEDFEKVVCNPAGTADSESSGLPVAFGYTEDGRYIMAIFEYLDEMTIIPVTAFEVPEPHR